MNPNDYIPVNSDAIPPEEIIDRFCAERLSFLEALPTFATFGKGWSRRVAGVKTESLNLA